MQSSIAPEAGDFAPLREDRLFVASIEKAMRVLSCFGEAHHEMGLQELAETTGLDKSATQRYAHTLHRLGYLEKDPQTRQYRPTLKSLELANGYLWADRLVRQAMPKLIDLRQTLGQTINLSRIDGSDIVYVVRLPSARTSYGAMIVGRRAPALNTSSGRSIVATYPADARAAALREWPLRRFTPKTLEDRDEIARLVDQAAVKGYSMSRDELMLNEIGVAAPIFDSEPQASAALHCSLSALRWSEAEVERKIVPPLLDVANSLV